MIPGTTAFVGLAALGAWMNRQADNARFSFQVVDYGGAASPTFSDSGQLAAVLHAAAAKSREHRARLMSLCGSSRRQAWAGSLAVATAMLAGCTTPRGQGEVPEFRDEVLAHMSALQDGWEDWLALLQASDVVEGTFHVDNPEDIKSRPEEYLPAHIEAPRVLLGRPEREARRFTVFNTTIRRWGYWPVYSSDIQESNGKLCVVFLHGHGKHVVDSAEGKVLPIMPLSDLAPRRSQLESFLYLARLDPVQVAHLVAKPDSRVDDIVQKARAATGNMDAAQSCYDGLRAMGADALPGILHAMTEVLLEPDSNALLEIDGISLRPPGSSSNEPSVRAIDLFDLLHLATGSVVALGLPPDEDPEGRWSRVRVIAFVLLQAEVLIKAGTTVTFALETRGRRSRCTSANS
jgi:hypothetical protein